MISPAACAAQTDLVRRKAGKRPEKNGIPALDESALPHYTKAGRFTREIMLFLLELSEKEQGLSADHLQPEVCVFPQAANRHYRSRPSLRAKGHGVLFPFSLRSGAHSMKISYPVFKSLLALSLGTFGVCMSEFSMMAVLPEVAGSLAVSIPEAGHFISAYALGVCAGAPLTVMTARSRPLRGILLVLMLLFIAGNALTAMATHPSLMLAARFIAGLPHGAYFGVAAIIADKLVEKAFSVLAVSIVIAGATIANLGGVPCSTLLTHLVSWRMAYALVACTGVVVIICVLIWVPKLPGLKHTGFLEQFRFLGSVQPWLIFLAIVLGNGGMFCWYSYVSPFLTGVSGLEPGKMTLVMAFAGAGMVLGNSLSGRLSVRFRPAVIAAGMQGVMAVSLLALFLLGTGLAAALCLLFLCTACLFGISAPQQMLLLQNARGGEMLGAAMAQVGFNTGNALGAFLGGLSIDAGFGYAGTACLGAAGAAVGFLLLFFYSRHEGR